MAMILSGCARQQCDTFPARTLAVHCGPGKHGRSRFDGQLIGYKSPQFTYWPSCGGFFPTSSQRSGEALIIGQLSTILVRQGCEYVHSACNLLSRALERRQNGRRLCDALGYWLERSIT